MATSIALFAGTYQKCNFGPSAPLNYYNCGFAPLIEINFRRRDRAGETWVQETLSGTSFVERGHHFWFSLSQINQATD
jgi:hypothetical protein